MDATAQSLRWAIRVPDRPFRLRTHADPARPQGSRPPPSSSWSATASTPTTGKMLPGQAAGLHLAEKGHAQAAAAAERIAALDQGPDRGLRVAAGAHPRDGGPHRPGARPAGADRPGLVEVDVGDWTEKPLTRLYRTPEWPTVQRWPGGFRFPGGESFAEMSVRSMDTVLGLVADHPGETIVAVSHADPIKAIVAAAAGMPLDLLQRLVISPCSISALLFTAGGPVVLCMNSTGTLNELALS